MLLNHPNIVKLVDFLYSETCFFLIFEYVQGSQLFDIILEKGPIKESNARRIFRQMLSAINYIHENSISHRDLKIENILMDESGNSKIIDFGLSNFYDNRYLLSTFCGSLYFAAPELLTGKKYLGPEIDIWSLGIILYVMICGTVPFDDKDIHSLQIKIKNAKIKFPNFVSKSAKNLISGMLLVNPSNRYSLKEIIGHDWTNEGFDSLVDTNTIERSKTSKFNKTAVQILEEVLSILKFRSFRKDLERFSRICIDQKRPLSNILLERTPSISIYYLFMENYDSKSFISANFYSFSKCCGKNDHVFEKLHIFVKAIFLKHNHRNKTRYSFGRVLSNSDSLQKYEPEISAKKNTSENKPCIRNSIVQGFFRGLVVNLIKNKPQMLKAIDTFFLKKEIVCIPNSKFYFCYTKNKKNICYFKTSLFYNIILRKFVVSLRHISGDLGKFKKVKASIRNYLN